MQRNTLMGAITNVLINGIPNIDLTLNNRQGLKDLNLILLNGSDALSYDDNILLFKAVHAYIRDTKLFDIG